MAISDQGYGGAADGAGELVVNWRNSLLRVARHPSIADHLPLVLRSLREEGLGFLLLWLRVRKAVRGWGTGTNHRLLYALAHHGPGKGAIVEIGSAWGKSTIFLARASKRARREKVYAIDPHTGDPWFLQMKPPAEFNSFEEFQRNLRKFGVDDWVIPVVSTSTDAARTLETGPIRLLYIDGLHTYEGVKADIADWVPRVLDGGIIVFDDYFNRREGVGVQRAVDELLASGADDPPLHQEGKLVWLRKFGCQDYPGELEIPRAV